MRNLNALMVIAFLGFSTASLAAERYVWDEQGIQKYANCFTTSQPKIPYMASPKSAGQWELSFGYTAPAGSKELKGFIFQNQTAATVSMGDRSLQGTYFEPAFDGQDYLVYVCQKGADKKAFIVFNVFAIGQENSIAQIGVAKTGFDFLKTSTLQTADEVTKKLLQVATPSQASSSPEKNAAPMGKLAEKDIVRAKPLNALSPVNRAKITFYDPNQNSLMEGGSKNRFTENINSIEDSIKNGRPITLAADIYGSFGSLCNQREKRCLVLVAVTGFDTLYPSYRKKFSQLPKDHFLGIIEDTGQAFFNDGGRHFDVAARNHKLARAVPSFVGKVGSWARMANPCGTGSRSRFCDLTMGQAVSIK